jgi:predicted RNA-binding Zn ribbon-like protein
MQPGVHELTGGDGQRFTFDPGTLSMELLLTGGPGFYARWEILDRPAVLTGWLPGTRLALGGPFTADDVHVTPAEFTRIRHLRDTLWSVATTLAAGEPPTGADVDTVNRYAAEAPPRPAVDPHSRTRRWVTPITGRQVLGAFARDALDVLITTGRVRQCSGVNCYLHFLDTSRPGNRRWCSMERCGNRNKVRAYRART